MKQRRKPGPTTKNVKHESELKNSQQVHAWYWNNIGVHEIVEAKEPLVLNPNADDIAKACPTPFGCALAVCAMRTADAKHAIILGRHAYLVKQVRDPKTKKHVLKAFRYTSDHRTNERIKLFDKAGPWFDEPVTLRAPTKSETLKESNKRSKEYHKPKYKAAKEKREAKQGKRQQKKKFYAKPYHFRNSQFRTGTKAAPPKGWTPSFKEAATA